jgi:hypothetical protein
MAVDLVDGLEALELQLQNIKRHGSGCCCCHCLLQLYVLLIEVHMVTK